MCLMFDFKPTLSLMNAKFFIKNRYFVSWKNLVSQLVIQVLYFPFLKVSLPMQMSSVVHGQHCSLYVDFHMLALWKLNRFSSSREKDDFHQ